MTARTQTFPTDSSTEVSWHMRTGKTTNIKHHNQGHMSQTMVVNDIQPVANLREISLEHLKNGDQTEAANLLAACQEDGVFYLNLKHSDVSDGELLHESASIYHLAKQLFNLPEEEKMQYDIDLFGDMKVNGYKPVGRNFGGIRSNKDGFESYAIAKDTILALDPLASQHPHPQPIAAALPLLRAFTTSIATATAAILASLSTSLAFPAAAGFHHHHRTLNRPSPDLLRLLKYPAQPAHERGAPQAPHTDLGTLTVLFASGDGLQRQAPRTGAWEYVVARRGCAVVNVGDGLEALSGGLLRSCVHRVVPVPGRAMRERWSFAYMQRAETGTLMAGLKGGLVPEGGEGGAEVLTCEEWLRRKFGALRRGTRRAEEEWVVTGRKVE